MSSNSLLPFTSTRCTASATLSSLSDPHDASGFQKAACGKKKKNTKLGIHARCSQEFCRHIIKAPGLDCQSSKWWTFQFKRHHLSPVCNTPWAQNSSTLIGSCFSTSLYSTSMVKLRAPLLRGSCFFTCLYGTSKTTLRYFYGLIKAAFEPSGVNRILNTDDNIPEKWLFQYKLRLNLKQSKGNVKHKCNMPETLQII